MERKKCPICKKPIGRNKICCSMECYAKYKSHYKTCIVCGKKFYDAKSNDTVCCSPKCSKKHRQDLYKQGVNKAATDKMVAARYSNPFFFHKPFKYVVHFLFTFHKLIILRNCFAISLDSITKALYSISIHNKCVAIHN